MAKDYFQDITPPDSNAGTPRPPAPPPPPNPETHTPPPPVSESAGRTIRDIQVSSTRQKLSGVSEMRDMNHPNSPRPPRSNAPRYALWGGVVLAIVVLAAIAVIALRPTSVTVVPLSHETIFDETTQFTAYPAENASENALTFTITTVTLEDSEVVAAKGIEHVEDRASGTLIVYNDYSAAPVKLIKNTRFETPEGLVYRIPAEVVIPGKKGSTPGQISVTVFADMPGEKYNIGPVDTFRLPGLASTPDMYKKVYARSTSAMVGGFSGDRPRADPSALEAARAQVRSRLEDKIRAAVAERTTETTFAFADLARVTFESLAPTAEEANVRINERVRLELPVFSADTFAYTIAESVSASAPAGGIILKPSASFAAHPTEASLTAPVSDPLAFTLEGKAQLVWKVDIVELAQALAGRDETAFQAIVQNFPGIKEARARIEPFWKQSFPSNPSGIQIRIEEPALP